MDLIKDIVICKDKTDKICSMGINIDSELAKNDVFILNKKMNDKKLFRKNIGVPLPLFLINEQYNDILDVIDVNGNSLRKNKKKVCKSEPISDMLFDRLLSLANKTKIPKTKKRKLKKKGHKKTKKNK